MTIEELTARIEALEKALAALIEKIDNDADAQDERFAKVQGRHERQMDRLSEQIGRMNR
jgi:hypothetical protein